MASQLEQAKAKLTPSEAEMGRIEKEIAGTVHAHRLGMIVVAALVVIAVVMVLVVIAILMVRVVIAALLQVVMVVVAPSSNGRDGQST